MIRICFICGKTDQETKIENHHIVPNRIKTKVIKKNNIMPVCEKCHHGIHNSGGRLLPHTKHWDALKKLARQVKNNKDFNNLIRTSIQMTIIDKLHDIQMYHEFLEYKEWYSAR